MSIPEGLKKIKLSSKGTKNFQILGKETLITADYEYENISRFSVLDIKLWLKDDNIFYQI